MGQVSSKSTNPIKKVSYTASDNSHPQKTKKKNNPAQP